MVLFGYLSRSGIVGSYDSYLFNFKGTSKLLFIVVVSVFIPAELECSLFSTPSPAFIVCKLFDDGHSDQCVVIPHYSFDLHFSKN